MARILVIEDEPDLASLLEYNLKADGHEVVLAATVYVTALAALDVAGVRRAARRMLYALFARGATSGADGR